MQKASRYIIIQTTLSSRLQAERLAKKLVEERLAACVSIIGPISSQYRFSGKLEKSREYLCLAKTRTSLYSRLEKAIAASHPYQIPEIIALPVIAGSRQYLAWLEAGTRTGKDK